ncbi:MAG: hypothetical protein M3452_00175, partial [Chloroflexota bacterium]|nr:hypothetical protein [Chloroflexota bacterium]
RDLGDKVSAEDRADVERKVEAVREALKGDDTAAVTRTAGELAEVLQRVSTAAYQAASASGDGSQNGSEGGSSESTDGAAPPDGASATPAPEGEEAVEGEYKEV